MWGKAVKMTNKRCPKDSAISVLLFVAYRDVGTEREQDEVAVSSICLE